MRVCVCERDGNKGGGGGGLCWNFEHSGTVSPKLFFLGGFEIGSGWERSELREGVDGLLDRVGAAWGGEDSRTIPREEEFLPWICASETLPLIGSSLKLSCTWTVKTTYGQSQGQLFFRHPQKQIRWESHGIFNVMFSFLTCTFLPLCSGSLLLWTLPHNDHPSNMGLNCHAYGIKSRGHDNYHMQRCANMAMCAYYGSWVPDLTILVLHA